MGDTEGKVSVFIKFKVFGCTGWNIVYVTVTQVRGVHLTAQLLPRESNKKRQVQRRIR